MAQDEDKPVSEGTQADETNNSNLPTRIHELEAKLEEERQTVISQREQINTLTEKLSQCLANEMALRKQLEAHGVPLPSFSDSGSTFHEFTKT